MRRIEISIVRSLDEADRSLKAKNAIAQGENPGKEDYFYEPHPEGVPYLQTGKENKYVVIIIKYADPSGFFLLHLL